MKGWRDPVCWRHWRFVSAVFLVAVLWLSALPLGAASESAWENGQAYGTEPLSAETLLKETVGLNDRTRSEAYGRIHFDPDGWTAGLVLSHRPFAVVSATADPEAEPDMAATVRVWTGLIARTGPDLVAVWDEIRVDKNGLPVSVLTAEPVLLPGYFAADDQRAYRAEAYIGLYPWVHIPTDREAAESNAKPVAEGGIIDLYGNDFGDAAVNYQEAGPVKTLSAVPRRIADRPGFTLRDIGRVPADAAGHWAEPYILDLMRKGIVDGYGDGTIRPHKTLTRAEFVKLVLLAVQVSPSRNGSGYPDVSGHWSGPYVAAADENGIVPKGDGKTAFRPDEPITRSEMSVVLAGALHHLQLVVAAEQPDYRDTAGLDDEKRNAIRFASAIGILSGFGDGTFRPGEPLTRAQAFVAIAGLANII